ncbi:hypothetical protein [Nautilia sp.]
MKTSIITSAILLTSVLLLSGCGGGGVGGSDTSVSTYSGYIKDSVIEGLDYICTDSTGMVTSSGTTDAEGKFTFAENTFMCNFGVKTSNDILILFTLATTAYLPDNLIFFPTVKADILQTLDNDANSSNGITITDNEKAVIAANYTGNDLMMASNSQIYALLSANDPNYKGISVSSITAVNNISQTIVNTVATGTYKGTFTLTSGSAGSCPSNGNITLNISVNTAADGLDINGYISESNGNDYNVSGNFLNGSANFMENDPDNTAWVGLYQNTKKITGSFQSANCNGTFEAALE